MNSAGLPEFTRLASLHFEQASFYGRGRLESPIVFRISMLL
jgi:hypothetical protein